LPHFATAYFLPHLLPPTFSLKPPTFSISMLIHQAILLASLLLFHINLYTKSARVIWYVTIYMDHPNHPTKEKIAKKWVFLPPFLILKGDFYGLEIQFKVFEILKHGEKW
jgi:hypothetical protein